MRYTKKLKIHIFDLRATDPKIMIPIPSLAGPARCNQKQIKINQHRYTFKNKLMLMDANTLSPIYANNSDTLPLIMVKVVYFLH